MSVGKEQQKNKYAEQIENIADIEKVIQKETKGVEYGALYDRNFLQMIDNPAVDVMHDINDGAIPFLMAKARYYPGCFFFFFDTRSIGQNASKSLCLFRNFPFILYDYRNNSALKAVWNCVTSFLRIAETVYSDEISDVELYELE